MEEYVEKLQSQVKILDESNLRWSIEKKGEVLAYMESIQKGDRDREKDQEYLYKAHDWLETHNPKVFLAKVKSVKLPFETVAEPGERIALHSYEDTHIENRKFMKDEKKNLNTLSQKFALRGSYEKKPIVNTATIVPAPPEIKEIDKMHGVVKIVD